MGVFSRLTGLIGDRIVVPNLPEGRTPLVVEADEPLRLDRARDSRSGLSYFIQYSGGSLSERRITIKRLHVEGDIVRALLAFCHERSAIRQFRADRIQEAVDIETGEILSSRDLCNALRNRGLPVAEQRLAAVTRILVFMARCDGETHHLEWDEIDRSIIRLSRCLMDDEQAIEDLMRDARRLAPDGKDFLKALRGLTKTRLPARLHQELRRAIGAVIEADGVQREEEVHWALEASDFIARMPTSG